MKNKILIISVLVIVAVFFGFNYFQNKNTPNNFTSRREFFKAMEFVKKDKPTPPVAAIFYAKVTEDIYSGKMTSVGDEYLKNLMSEIKSKEAALPNVNFKVGNSWNEYWVGQNPFSPKISQHERFLLKDFNYTVPIPPKYKSPEFYAGLNAVKEAALNRTTEQGALVNFYGGVPGTEGPSGIWQNILWENVKMNKELDNEKYSQIQMVLAQSLADSFMECWKIKYMYQTKRPDMTDKNINLAMPNPPFPSYTSGHSAISFTAANILGHFLPEKKELFLKNATDAKNSRLWAGIHFPYDNDQGQKLGEEVAKNILQNL